MSKAARKAWNEAMKQTAGAVLSTAGPQKRRSDRHQQNKKDRRKQARRVQQFESEEFRTAVWVDTLEGVDLSAVVENDDDQEDYDELDELLGDGKKKKRKRKEKTTVSSKKGVLPKRFLPRPLANILLDEHTRADGIALAWLQAEARLPVHQQRPPPKLCPVTGVPAPYVEPKSGIPFSGLRALEQIRERPPPWMTLGGTAAFLETSKTIQGEE